MEEKRTISILIPYKIKEGRFFVYLQKRTDDAKRLPGNIAYFGGGLEAGELPEQALMREIKEELDFFSPDFEFFRKYEFEHSILHVFIYQAPQDFELKVTIMEGEYGRWYDGQEALEEPKMSDDDKRILLELREYALNLSI